MEPDTVEPLRRILIQLQELVDAGLPLRRVEKIRREAVFYLYEGGQAAQWDFSRPHSAAARRLRERSGATGPHCLGCRKQLTYDHAIPLVSIRAGLRNALHSAEGFRDFLARHVRGVVILREENARPGRFLPCA